MLSEDNFAVANKLCRASTTHIRCSDMQRATSMARKLASPEASRERQLKEAQTRAATFKAEAETERARWEKYRTEVQDANAEVATVKAEVEAVKGKAEAARAEAEAARGELAKCKAERAEASCLDGKDTYETARMVCMAEVGMCRCVTSLETRIGRTVNCSAGTLKIIQCGSQESMALRHPTFSHTLVDAGF